MAKHRKRRRPNLSRQDKRDIVFLSGCALSGILADHEHHQGFGGLTCAQASCEWAARYGFELHLRLKQKFSDFEKGPVTFPLHVTAYAPRQ